MLTLIIVALTYVLTSGSFGSKVIAIASNLELLNYIVLGVISVIFMVVFVVLYVVQKELKIPSWLNFLIGGKISFILFVVFGLRIVIIFLLMEVQKTVNVAATSWGQLGSDAQNSIILVAVIWLISTIFTKISKKGD